MKIMEGNMAMAGSGMIPDIAISIRRIGNFNHTGRKAFL